MSDPHTAVEAHVAALNHGDLQDVLNTFATDAVFTSDGGTVRGRVQLAGLFDSVVGDHRPTTILRASSREGDASLRCRLTRRFTVVDEQGRIAATHDVDFSAVFTVADGEISRVEVDPMA